MNTVPPTVAGIPLANSSPDSPLFAASCASAMIEHPACTVTYSPSKKKSVKCLSRRMITPSYLPSPHSRLDPFPMTLNGMLFLRMIRMMASRDISFSGYTTYAASPPTRSVVIFFKGTSRSVVLIALNSSYSSSMTYLPA